MAVVESLERPGLVVLRARPGRRRRSAAGEGRADRIVLRGGGQIRGKVIPDPDRPDRVTVVTETGKTPLTFQKPQILQVIAEPERARRVRGPAAEAPTTAEAQYELGLWCEQHKLSDLAEIHYEAAVKHDKTFAPAHQKLGHVRYGDRWLSATSVREAQGLVRYKGQVDLEGREGPSRRAGGRERRADVVGPADPAAPPGDRCRAGRPPPRGRGATDGDPRPDRRQPARPGPGRGLDAVPDAARPRPRA